MKYAQSVEEFFERQDEWLPALEKLRKAILATGVEETLKWGIPVYVHNKTNVAGIASFKEWVAIWFYQGALMDDPKRVLINAQKGRTQALRQWRFTSAKEIRVGDVKDYLREAMRLAEQGKAVKPRKSRSFTVPVELAEALKSDRKAAAAFKALSPSCQREYAEHVGEAKKEETRLRRATKALGLIAAGQGLNDRYR